MKSRTGRVSMITGGLLVAGAICGSVAALAGFSLAVGLVWRQTPPLIAYAVVLAGGALLGAPLLPATGWLLLRRVPLWLSFLGTTVGAVIGGVIGAIVSTVANGIYGPLGGIAPLLGAVIGFFTAVVVLRRRYPAPRERVRVPNGARA